jgi:uncharacterized protein YcgI (DUF1989 family)
MLIELGKWGLGMRDVVSNINFFSKVTASESGELIFHSGSSKAGDYVDLGFEMDTLVVLSAAPHPLDPSKTYRPGAVGLAAFATPSAVPGDFRWQGKGSAHIAENERGLQNTQRLYTCGGAA